MSLKSTAGRWRHWARGRLAASRMNRRTDIAAPAIVKRRKFVLCGFFGRGNAGDEAFLHVQHALLSPHFEMAIVVEKSGAHRDFASWYPYKDCEVWSFDEVDRLYDSAVYGLNIGGGSLPFAYHGQYLLSALDSGKKTLMTGIDASIRPDTPGEAIRRAVYDQVDYFSVRTEKSYQVLRKAGIEVSHGADWALGLEPTKTGFEPVDIVVTLRGFSQPDNTHIEARKALEQHLSRQGRKVTYLPFAPEDRDFLAFCGVPERQTLNMWHDPGRTLEVIEKSQLVISIGRLHTLIFSLTRNVPCFAIDPGIVHDGRKIANRKNQYFCKENNLRFFDSIQDFIDSNVDLGPETFPPRNFTPDYHERYAKMTSDIAEVLTL